MNHTIITVNKALLGNKAHSVEDASILNYLSYKFLLKNQVDSKSSILVQKELQAITDASVMDKTIY